MSWLWLRGMLAACLTLALHAMPADVSAATRQLTPAQVTVHPEGQPSRDAEPVLPLHWDAMQRGAAGKATFLFLLPRPDGAADSALYLPRIGNTFRIELNGRPIAHGGAPGDRHADLSKQPRTVRLAARHFQDQNRLVITIDAQSTRKAGLGRVVFGPLNEIEAMHAASALLRTTGSLVVAVASAVLGGLALLLWLRQRDRLYLSYGLAELLWALSLADTLFDRTPLAWPWWGVVVYSAQAVAGMLIVRFALTIVGHDHGAVHRATQVLLWAAPPILGLALVNGSPALELAVLVPSQWVGVMAGWIVVRHGWRSDHIERRVLAIGMLLVGAVLLRDAWVLVLRPYVPLFGGWGNHYGEVAWIRYAWGAFGFSLAWVIAERMRRSERLTDRTLRELAEQQQRFAERLRTEREQVRLDERHRLTRDVHDGVGSHLVGALRLAQDASVPREVLQAQLRNTLDELKLTIDAMHDTDGDIASLLGALRHRLEPRLRAAGVQLAWSVPPLPPLPDWSLGQSRDLQMILFEAFSNLLSHAQARHAWLDAVADSSGRQLRIELRDDGIGFEPDLPAPRQGRGLANMRLRATRLGARLQWHSGPQGTRLRLELDLP